MYAVYFVLTAAALAAGGAATVLTRAAGGEMEGDAGAIAATFSAYARGAQAYAHANGVVPDTLDQFRLDPAFSLPTRSWGGRARGLAASATWSLQQGNSADPAARDICVELAGVKSRAALVTLVQVLPRTTYISGASCAGAPASGSAPASFPSAVAFRLPALP